MEEKEARGDDGGQEGAGGTQEDKRYMHQHDIEEGLHAQYVRIMHWIARDCKGHTVCTCTS